jgi:hypothetical protein
MESNITPFTDCPPLVKKLDQCQLYFERGSDGRSKNIYKWVSPEYNANRQKMNHPKISKEKPYNRKYGEPNNKRPGSLLVYVNILQNKVSEENQLFIFTLQSLYFPSLTFFRNAK